MPPAPPGLLTGQERTWLRKAHIERGEDPVRLVAIDSRGDRYVQVLLCDDGTYGLEHRAGTGSEHCRSRALSRDEVLSTLLGWAADAIRVER
ncbi:hypothetical protein [Streptomyces lavendulae]|uniref:hypothetical protein n=1 Tax=Streptomyces lavendulae TaxID=1914 RepID=UPI0033E335E5